MEVLKIKFKNENFGKLFENRIFINMKFLTLKDEELRGPNTWPFWIIHWGWPCMAMRKWGLGGFCAYVHCPKYLMGISMSGKALPCFQQYPFKKTNKTKEKKIFAKPL